MRKRLFSYELRCRNGLTPRWQCVPHLPTEENSVASLPARHLLRWYAFSLSLWKTGMALVQPWLPLWVSPEPRIFLSATTKPHQQTVSEAQAPQLLATQCFTFVLCWAATESWMLGLYQERLGSRGLKGFLLDLWSLPPGHHPRLRASSRDQMGQRYTALNREGRSDFRKLGHQGERAIFTEVTVRHPRRKMALDSPDRVCTHEPLPHTHTTQTHVQAHTRDT